MTEERKEYLVLARKYRPRTFKEMIGQQTLVRTLTNAIESNRLHHAYVLQGIRGTGKTTTARILAKVLNCENGPATHWEEKDPQALAIEKGNHVDVLEFDAASHTGVDDIRELFEGVHYAPVQGRYKVYIIDEVHMLSKQAFNALLKTLEEPPSHVKFIFATTEVHKIPVTVLSRCQRFDLKRVSSDELAAYFCTLLDKESVQYDEAAVQMIARAADGSVRDGLSLLDQAIALSVGSSVSLDIVSNMLGMADKAMVYTLLTHMMKGEVEQSLDKLANMYEIGFDPLMIVSDLLSACHLITRLKVVPNLKDSKTLTEIERTQGGDLAQNVALDNISRVYQMLLTVANEAKQASRPYEAVEMGLIRVTHMAPMPSIRRLLDGELPKVEAGNATVGKPLASAEIQRNSTPEPASAEHLSTPKNTASTHKNTTSTPVVPTKVSAEVPAEISAIDIPPIIENWRSFVEMLKHKDSSLAAYVTQNVRPNELIEGTFTISIQKGLYAEDELLVKLKQATPQSEEGEPLYKWHLARQKSKNPTLEEVEKQEGEMRKIEALKRREMKQLFETFPEAEVIRVDK